jgi:hypothetical protein
LFSAAIPNQGGQNHVNEQWPEYWQKKFAKHNYVFHDVLRTLFWDNDRIYWWYKQNTFLVAHRDYNLNLEALPTIPLGQDSSKVRRYVHPDLFTERMLMYDDFINGRLGLKQYFKFYLKKIINR